MNKNLLSTPEGVGDTYGEELFRKRKLEEKLLRTVASFGYQEIETPVFEYFDVFSGEVGTTPSRELYKFFDKEGETLALRPDFTPSIVRFAAGLKREDASPLRLTYHGKTFTNAISLQGKKHEVTQLGAELMGDASEYADAEILGLIVNAFHEIGLTDFQISIGNADFFRGLCEAAGLSPGEEEQLRGHVKSKNQVAARAMLVELNLPEDYSAILLRCTDLFGDFDSLVEARRLLPESDAPGLEKSRRALDRLQRVYDLLAPYDARSHIGFDLGLLSRYHYYTGLIFKGYTYGLGDAIVTGGRYDALSSLFGNQMPAIGFAIVVDDLLHALDYQKIDLGTPDKTKSVRFSEEDYEAVMRKVMEQRKQGAQVCACFTPKG